MVFPVDVVAWPPFPESLSKIDLSGQRAVSAQMNRSEAKTFLTFQMEVFSHLFESTYGVAAFSSVTLAVGMLFGTLSLLIYKAKQSMAALN